MVQHIWLYEEQEYVEAVERAVDEATALFELEGSMLINRILPEDREAIAKRRSNYKAAIEARREDSTVADRTLQER